MRGKAADDRQYRIISTARQLAEAPQNMMSGRRIISVEGAFLDVVRWHSTFPKSGLCCTSHSTVLIHIQPRRKIPEGIEQGSSRRACDGHTGSTVRSSLKSPQNIGVRHIALIVVWRILLFILAFNTLVLCTLWIVVLAGTDSPNSPREARGRHFVKS